MERQRVRRSQLKRKVVRRQRRCLATVRSPANLPRMTKPQLDDLLKLPVSERIDLAMALWDSIAEADLQDQLPLTEAQKAELERRLAEHDRDPSRAIPWEEVQRRLRDK
jgi:putative addiction module component (TIGR02574 family)